VALCLEMAYDNFGRLCLNHEPARVLGQNRDVGLWRVLTRVETEMPGRLHAPASGKTRVRWRTSARYGPLVCNSPTRIVST
jgi:hypothetical protein